MFEPRIEDWTSKLLFFDFDGVLVDSAEECYAVCLALKPLPKIHPEEKKRFLRHRGQVLCGDDFPLLLQAVRNSLEQDLESEEVPAIYAKALERRSEREKKKDGRNFFGQRYKLQKKQAQWLALHKLTALGENCVGKRLSNAIIVTTKDAHSVRLLLEHFRIPIRTVLDREAYLRFGGKGKTMSNFLDHSPFSEAIFVDDLSGHLESVDDPRIACYQAPWGYGKRDSKWPEFPSAL